MTNYVASSFLASDGALRSPSVNFCGLGTDKAKEPRSGPNCRSWPTDTCSPSLERLSSKLQRDRDMILLNFRLLGDYCNLP
jgi:hypothetical protein